MTVCIAALCANGKSCVVAADRMATFGFGSSLLFKVDDRMSKIHKLPDNGIFMHSGTGQDALEIVSHVAQESEGSLALRLERAIETVLKNRRDVATRAQLDCTYKELVDTVKSIPHGPIQEIWQAVRKIDCGAGILVSRDSDVFHLRVYDERLPLIRTDLPYTAIGSGGTYARAALTIQGFSEQQTIPVALYQVYSAKKAAELVFGVGDTTNMAVLASSGIKDIETETIEMLETFRTQRSQQMLTDNECESVRKSIGFSHNDE